VLLSVNTNAAPIDDLLAALRAERRALLGDDGDALPALAADKLRCLRQLQAALRTAPAAALAALAGSLALARRLNDDNSALLGARQSCNRARLDALLAACGQAASGVYGAGGELATRTTTARASASA